jgi:hypothetical protein
LGTIVGAVVQYIGWKKAKFLFWLLVWLLAVRGTVLFVAEWADAGEFSKAVAHYDGFGMWLIPCAVLLFSYIRWVYKGNRDRMRWIVLPAGALFILCMVGAAVSNGFRAAREYGMAQLERQANAPVTCVMELNGYYHCAQDIITPTGIHITLRQCTEQEVAMAIPIGHAAWEARPVCWSNQSPPPPPKLPAELEQLPTASWIELKAGIPDDQSGASSTLVKLSFCKPGFKCAVLGPYPYVKGPFCFVNQAELKNYTGPHTVHIGGYRALDADEKSAVQAFCQQGLNILEGIRVDDTSLSFSHTEYVPVCDAIPASSRTSNSLAETELEPRMRWGMSKEQVRQIRSEEVGGGQDVWAQPTEEGADNLIYRQDSAHFSRRFCYYFREGKLVEIRQDEEEGYMPSEYGDRVEEFTKKFGQPVKQDVKLSFQPIRSATFVSPNSVIVIVSYRNQSGETPYSVISLDRSQPQLVAR